MNNLKRQLNLDLDALRALVIGIELGNFHLAAKQLCRSPAAISAQLKKLAEQTGCELLKKQGRNLVLTAQGEILFRTAKEILFKHDMVLAKLTENHRTGEIHFGLQEDFENSLLQDVIAKFIKQYPNVKFQTQVDRNFSLIKKVEQQSLDLALIWQQEQLTAHFNAIKTVATHWLKQQDFQLSQLLESNKSIPLIVISEPCKLRQMAINLLDEHRLAWHIAYECNSVNALWSAVRAGLGITLRANFAIPTDLTIIQANILPSLPTMTLGIYTNHKTLPKLNSHFEECIINSLKS